MSRWFVMLYGRTDNVPIPLVVGGDEQSWNDDVVLFDTEDEADMAGLASPLGGAFGYELYEWPG